MSDCYKFKKEDNEEIKSIANVIREKKILDNKIIMDSFESFNFKDNDEKKEFMMTTTKLFLNDRKIEEINNLVIYEKLEEIYLQRNLITKIENLEFSKNLIILSLHYNGITEIIGLKHLKNLKILDLSENSILKFGLDEIPSSLEFLYLYFNPFFIDFDLIKYRYDCINRFKDLIILDSL